MKLTPNQWTILERLEKGPCWSRSFQWVKPLVTDLIGRNLVERCRPPRGTGSNMLRLTIAGCDLLEVDPAVPTGDTRLGRGLPPPAVLPPAVDRDPCPRCGVRGDFGCPHSRLPLVVSL